MIALDTNVLARYILQDDPDQSAKANRAIARLSPNEPGFVAAVVLCELIWVLQSTYKVSRLDCVATLKSILSVSSFEIECSDLCWKALRAYAEAKADFCDFLIRAIALEKGCSVVLTFDKAALKCPGFAEPQ